MANVSRVNGFRPVKHLNGSPYNGQFNKYFIPSTDNVAVFVGDIVKLASSASADGYPTVAQAAAGNTGIGVVVGFEADPNALNVPIYRPASTDRVVYVADAPDLIFEAQEDAVGGALTVAGVGLNVNFIVGAGSTSTGASGMQVDTSTALASSTLPLQILGFVDRIDNEIGSANAKVLVRFNVHQYQSVGTTGV